MYYVESCLNFVRVISASKIQIFKQPARRHSAHDTPVYLNSKALEKVKAFRYLGRLFVATITLSLRYPQESLELLQHLMCVWK